ncbi:MAG: LLM class flavin-dependent oxidoreductase [bacterium]|nr:LLM class flavin-dependent oxidoreductase [bacterium]MCP5065930.1 LLM class flavin-dependent oxidoreductase [bacterium]
MRVGLSWDLDRFEDASAGWQEVISEVVEADRMGFHSFWIHEGRERPADCPMPSVFLTYLSRKTQSGQLRIAGRRVTHALAPHIVEEVSVLDNFSRGRAGLAFAPASRQGVVPGHVHEMIDFVTSSWATDEMRFRGEHIRFPAHTPDEAPAGASVPDVEGDYVPQWEWGPEMPDFLSITPKPYVPHTPVHVEIDDDETLEWAAQQGISPMVGADMPTEQAARRLARYREIADEAGRSRREIEAVLERRVVLDGETDECTLGGSPRDVLNAIRDLRGKTGISHFVWRRGGATPMDLYRFASEVQVLLQA